MIISTYYANYFLHSLHQIDLISWCFIIAPRTSWFSGDRSYEQRNGATFILSARLCCETLSQYEHSSPRPQVWKRATRRTAQHQGTTKISNIHYTCTARLSDMYQAVRHVPGCHKCTKLSLCKSLWPILSYPRKCSNSSFRFAISYFGHTSAEILFSLENNSWNCYVLFLNILLHWGCFWCFCYSYILLVTCIFMLLLSWRILGLLGFVRIVIIVACSARRTADRQRTLPLRCCRGSPITLRCTMCGV